MEDTAYWTGKDGIAKVSRLVVKKIKLNYKMVSVEKWRHILVFGSPKMHVNAGYECQNLRFFCLIIFKMKGKKEVGEKATNYG